MALRLRTMGDIRRFLASLINQVRDGTLQAETASKLTYIGNVLIKATHLEWEQTKMMELEDRLNQLEHHLDQQED